MSEVPGNESRPHDAPDARESQASDAGDVATPVLAAVTRRGDHELFACGGESAVYSIATRERLAGALPPRKEGLVTAWLEIHAAELARNWDLLQSGRLPRPIEPLR